MRQRLLLLACGVACLLAPVVAAGAPGDVLEVFKNPNPEGARLDWFGRSIGVSGKNVLIGSPYAYGPGQGRGGAAYLFDGTTGELLRSFWNPQPLSGNDTFGSSVAVLGDNFLIGGPDCGVYLFDGSTGEVLRSFQDPVPTLYDAFGSSVVVLGENILVGDPYDSAVGWNAGALYLLDGSTGELLRTFSNPDPSNHNLFGISVAAVGANVLVGAYDDDPLPELAGIAYLFGASGGEVLLSLDPRGAWHYPGWHFGRTVAAYGDDLLVAGKANVEEGEGGVMLFDGTSGEVIRRLIAPDLEPGSGFGWSLAVVGDDVLVGASGAPELGGGRGYLFDGASGDLLLTLYDPGGNPGVLGGDVAAFGRDILISAPGDDSEGKDVGRVYLLQGVPEPSTLVLLAIAGAVALLLMWRRGARHSRHSQPPRLSFEGLEDRRYLTETGFSILPYLQDTTETSIVIMWETQQDSTDNEVLYRVAGSGGGFASATVDLNADARIAEIKLPELSAATTYEYRVRSKASGFDDGYRPSYNDT